MGSYIVRIELRNAPPAAYARLRDEMKQHGFMRTLMCKGGINYRLPSDEFAYVGTEYRQEIMHKVFALAERISANPAVLVTESLGRYWRGLDAIEG